jgi:hypothetical protein
MIHFLPSAEITAAAPSPAPVAARLAGVAHALAVVEAIGGETPGPAHPALAAASASAGDPLVDMLSEQLALGSAAGLEALAELGDAGLEANPAAARMLADAIRDGLDAMGVVLSL